METKRIPPLPGRPPDWEGVKQECLNFESRMFEPMDLYDTTIPPQKLPPKMDWSEAAKHVLTQQIGRSFYNLIHP